jgi:hypothetical protein
MSGRQLRNSLKSVVLVPTLGIGQEFILSMATGGWKRKLPLNIFKSISSQHTNIHSVMAQLCSYVWLGTNDRNQP